MASRGSSSSSLGPPSCKRPKWADNPSDQDPDCPVVAAATATSSSNSLEVSSSSGMDSGFSDGDTQAASGEDSQESFAAKFAADHAVYSTEEEEEEDMPEQRNAKTSFSGLHHFSPPSSKSLEVPEANSSAELQTEIGRELQEMAQEEGEEQGTRGEEADAQEENDEDDDDRLSSISGLSDLSGADWKPNAGPFSWVQQQMMKGTDPRVLLQDMISADSEIPDNLDQLTLWKIILNMLSEPPRRKKLDFVNTLGDVASLIKKCSRIIVLTGAGVSVSSGIPDFRSRDGVYARLAVDFPDLPDPQAMFDVHYFKKDPRPFFKFAREIYPGQFKPSPCHRFIRNVEKQGKLLRNYTQNIDTLEQVSGIENVIQCHGSFATATCMKCKHKVQAEEIKEDIFEQRIPYCKVCPTKTRTECSNPASITSTSLPEPSNSSSTSSSSSSSRVLFDASHMPASARDDPDTLTGDYDHSSGDGPKSEEEQRGIMKPDIIFFGEGLGDEFHNSVSKDKTEVDLLIMIGSSLKVRPVALIPSSVPASVPQILINREPLPHLSPDVELLGDCDGIVNQLCLLLGEGWEDALQQEQPQLEEDTELLPAAAAEEESNQSAAAAVPEADAAVADAPANEDADEEEEDAAWMPRKSLALRLKPGKYHFQPPSRYIFPGAEVFSDDDSGDDEEDSSGDDDESNGGGGGDDDSSRDSSSRDRSSSQEGPKSSSEQE